MKRIWALFVARNLEFVRDRSSLAWNFLFPVILIVGMSWVFSGPPRPMFKVGVVGEVPAETTPGFRSTPHVQWIPYADPSQATERLRRHQLDFLWQPPDHYWVNPSAPNGDILESIFKSTVSHPKREAVHGDPIRYVDWLVSGLLAMNMMFSGLFGVGYVIVRYRKVGVLKRFQATPVAAMEFLVSQVVSRLFLMMTVTTLVYAGTHAMLHFRMMGSYLNLFIVMLMGAMCLVSLGLLIASRTSSEEFSGGILNFISWPMMLLSGVWFSLEGAGVWVTRVAKIFPLTHVIEAARAIMTEGATLAQVSGSLGVLALMTAVFLLLGTWLFRWN